MPLNLLERKIMAELKGILKNPKLKEADLLEWSSSEKSVKDNLKEGELYVYCPILGIHCAVPKTANKNRYAPAGQ